MAASRKNRKPGKTPKVAESAAAWDVDTPKTSRTFRLSGSKIRAAQEILGVSTATAAIEMALDMVVFRQELVDGTAAMLGVEIDPA
jgi:hypothetical protein